MNDPSFSLDDQAQRLMMAALDDELTGDQSKEWHTMLATREEVRREFEHLQGLKRMTRSVQFNAPPEKVWEQYWTSVYYKMERGVAWILISLSTTLALAYAGWRWASRFLSDPNTPDIVKAAVITGIAGFALLVVSVAREKWLLQRLNPYKEVQR